MKHKVFWLHVGNVPLDLLQTCICLFIDLGVYCCYIWSCVLVQRIATRAPNMTTPVKQINKKVGVLKMGWLAVRDVLIELATVIIYYGIVQHLQLTLVLDLADVDSWCDQSDCFYIASDFPAIWIMPHTGVLSESLYKISRYS